MTPKPTCLCGECKRCRRREYMRAYQRDYYADPEKRAKKNERAHEFRQRNLESVRAQDRARANRPEVRARQNELRRQQHAAIKAQREADGLVLPRVKDNQEITAEMQRAHSMVKRAKAKGLVAALPCEICGHPRAEAHHDDYSRPLDLRWLCQKHHALAHRRLRQQKMLEILKAKQVAA